MKGHKTIAQLGSDKSAGVLYISFILSPALGAVLMSVAKGIVAINVQLLECEMGQVSLD